MFFVLTSRGKKGFLFLWVTFAVFAFIFSLAGIVHSGDSPEPGDNQFEKELEDLRVSILTYEKTMSPTFLGGGTDQPSLKAEWVFAELLLNQRIPSQAARVLETWIAKDKNGPYVREAWEGLQKLFYRQGRYQKSLGAFFRISGNKSAPIKSDAILIAGNSYLHIGEYGPAIQMLNRIPSKDPLYPFALYSLGLASIRSDKDSSRALRPLRKLIRLNTKGEGLRGELVNQGRITAGIYLRAQKKYSASVKMFATVNLGSRYRSAALYGMGSGYVAMKDCVKALVVFEELAEKFPVSPYGLEATIRIGGCFARLTAYRTSISRYRTALRVLANEREFLENLQLKKINSSPVSAPALYRRFISGDTGVKLPGGPSWSAGTHEIKNLRTRLDRIEKALEKEEGVQEMRTRVRESRKKLDSIYERVLSDRIKKRISWIESLSQKGTLQIVKNIILIQTYDPSN